MADTLYPAIDIRGADADLALAVADDFAPSAVDDLADGISIFFRTRVDRDRACDALALSFPDAAISARDVDDEDWARRSQQDLTPVTVDRITVLPPWVQPAPHESIVVVISPSMGFGTGHHATTRLCLAALQGIRLEERQVLDIGTGSGVLALASRMLGAARALGIDVDPDAITSARENLALNPSVDAVSFEIVDLQAGDLPQSEVVLANLTGATLVLHAQRLQGCVAPGGTLIVSGLQDHERDSVLQAFEPWTLAWDRSEAGWTGLAFLAASQPAASIVSAGTP